LWITGTDAAPGAHVPARVLARDVSLALSERRDSSILNVLPARVVSLDETAPGRSSCGSTSPARRCSRASRGARPPARHRAGAGEVFAQVKGVALAALSRAPCIRRRAAAIG